MTKERKLENILYYLIEKTNKIVRRYSQIKFTQAGLDLTVDQWLVLKKVGESSGLTQIEVANALFKDRASITRTLDLLLKKNLIRKEGGEDKRTFQLRLTAQGKRFADQALVIVNEVRRQGVAEMSEREQTQLKASLQKIIENLES